jgi:transposase
VRRALVEAAQAARHTKETYLAVQLHRLVSRRGKKKAAVAVGHRVLVRVYYLLQRGTSDGDPGGQYFEERHRHTVTHHLVDRLERLGYQVTLHPVDPAA